MNRIREERQLKKLTLKETVEQLKTQKIITITSDALSKYERGDREPKQEVWQKLADFFNVSVPYLQGYDSVATNINPVTHTKNYAVIMNNSVYSPFATEDEARKFLKEKCNG